ncbi:MAG: hypothetical protein U9N50_02520 [Pseudomonadota bacterium]|nr:hypothetical protein [Pseudomonadota bacterium]
MNNKLTMGLKISLACAICPDTIALIVKLVEKFQATGRETPAS